MPPIHDQMEKRYRAMPLEKISWNNQIPTDALISPQTNIKIGPYNDIEFGCRQEIIVYIRLSRTFDVTGVKN